MNDAGKFLCGICTFSSKFDYFGQTPPFAKNLVVMEDAYIMKDPFSDEKRCIILGSHCSVCNRIVCVSQDCSLFYTKRFCMDCVKADIGAFPPEIQLEVTKKKSLD